MELQNGFFLSNVEVGDEDAYVTHLSDGQIGEMIPVLPYPYGRAQAESWVQHRITFRTQSGLETTFAIRRPEGQLIGSVGVDDYLVGKQHTAELGYWLAPSERGRGLATAAVIAFIRYAFDSLRLAEITARTLSCNPASTRVLEKAYFRFIEVRSSFTKTRKGTFDTRFYKLSRENSP